MPSHSVKQAKVMSAIAHGWKPKGSVAKIPVKVAKDFHAADAGHKYGKGMHHKRALHIARKHAKKKADGGATDDEDKAAAISIRPVDPNAGLAQDLGKKTPIEGMDVPGPSLSAHQDTPRERMTNWLAGPDTPSYAPRSVLANKAMNVLDFTPPMMAEQAGEDIAKGEYQNAAMFAMPGVKKAKAGLYDFEKAIGAAANYAIKDDGPTAGQQYIMKSLKAEYPKDIATKAIEKGYTPEQIDNLKTYMSPGAQGAFEKHYNKMAPKAPPAPWNAPEIQATKPLPFGSGALNMDEMSKIGGQLGTNPGGMYEAPNGSKYYIKEGKTPDHVKNEMIAADLYRTAGVPTLNYHPVQGGNHIATEWAQKEKDNANKFNPQEHAQAADDFAVHAWLANHDVVGTGGDNLGIINGKVTPLDLGGALEYRAQGAPKGKSFGTSVGELDSMRGLDPDISAPDAAKVFGHMDFEDMYPSAQKVVAVSDDKIKAIVAAHGGDPKLAEKLIARKNDIAERFGLQTLNPNYIANYHAGQGKSIDDLIKEIETALAEPKKPTPKGKDTDIEDYYAEMEKHEAGPEWEPEDEDPHYTPSPGNPNPQSAPYKQYLSGKIGYTKYEAELRNAIVPSSWKDYRPKDVKPEEVPKVNWGANNPEDLEKIGVNPHTILLKGGTWNTYQQGPFVPGGYPKELMDPKAEKDAEQAFHMATKPGIAYAYHGSEKIGGPYVARDPKFYELDWPSIFGSNHYSDGDLDKVAKFARQKGADIVAVHNMHDTGSAQHGLHTQYLVLNTHVLRAPHAAFDPTKWHLRHPLAGLAGGGIFTYGALSGEPEQKKDGGKVAKKEKDPEEHEFINFAKGGLIDSDIPGRTDKIPMKVAAGSYVLPADIPSALGQGNTKAGSEVLKKMFTSGPYGLAPPKGKSGQFHFAPFPSIGLRKKAEGGEVDHVPIIAAGGEYIIHPDMVREIGHGDMAKGHKVLDKFVLHARKEHIKTLRKLKPPKP